MWPGRLLHEAVGIVGLTTRMEIVPSLRWAYESVAKLGGWIDTKRTGRAGWKALWEGWFILEQRVEGYRLAQQLKTR